MYMPEYLKLAEEKSLLPTAVKDGVMDFAYEGDASANRNQFLHKVRHHLRAGGEVSEQVYGVFQPIRRSVPPAEYSAETKYGLETGYPIIRASDPY